MKNILKKNYKLFIGIVIGVLITTGVVYATIISSSDISYDNTKSGIEATNVKDAIDELYNESKNSNKCPDGYTCLKQGSTCEYQCSNGWIAKYENGLMVSCRHVDSKYSKTCGGGYYGQGVGYNMYGCKKDTTVSVNLYDYCQAYNPYNYSVNGGGCPEIYNCP